MDRIKKALDASVASLAPGIIPLRKRKLVLCYHRLGSDSNPGESRFHNPVLTTPAKSFERQMQWLSAFCEFKPLNELYSHQETNDSWQVTITFDDGYQDNLELGLPILSQYQIPVTFFPATAYIENPALIPWWDLCSFLNTTPDLKGLEEALNDTVRNYSTGYNKTGSFNHRLCAELTHLNTSGPHEKACELNRIVTTALQQIDPTLQNEMLRPDELVRLSQSPLVSIGSHTDTHPNLSLLSEPQQRAELVRSAQRLSQWQIRTGDCFAYPFGKSRHYTLRTSSLLEEQGVVAAVTTDAGYVTSSSSRYHLPRFSVDGRWSLDTFKARVLAGPVIDGFRQRLWLRPAVSAHRQDLQPDDR
ncbi:MAG: polysaccharide deacetylase family protein [Endozoicomonas sp.]